MCSVKNSARTSAGRGRMNCLQSGRVKSPSKTSGPVIATVSQDTGQRSATKRVLMAAPSVT